MAANLESVTWLVQRPPAGDDSPTLGLLTPACGALGVAIQEIDVVPGKPPPLPPARGPVVVHGRRTLLATALRDPIYRRGVFGDEQAFLPSAYLRGWGARMLNADQRRASWDEALRAVEKEPLFVRPDDDDKLFTGRVFNARELGELFRRLQESGGASGTCRVVVASAKEVDAEARLFVVQRRVVGGSFYRPGADPHLPADLLAFAQEAIEAWQPHDVFALDVARASGEYRIVEANGFNGSRLYAADVVEVVRSVSAYQAARW